MAAPCNGKAVGRGRLRFRAAPFGIIRNVSYGLPGRHRSVEIVFGEVGLTP